MEKNKISLYLIKDEYEEEDIIKGYQLYDCDDNHKIIRFNEDVKAFYCKSIKNKPSWVYTFFNDNERLVKDLTISNSKLLLLLRFISDGKTVRMAMAMGYGKNILNDNAIEENFGLKIVLNSIESNNLRKIGKINIGGNQKSSTEQLPKQNDILEFGFDIDRDIINEVNSKVENDIWFKGIMTGKDVFSVTSEVNIDNIIAYAKYCYSIYKSNKYKENFAWIDNIKILKNKKKIEDLDNYLIEHLKSNDCDFVLGVPEVIDWSGIRGFKVPGIKKIVDDLSIELLLSSFRDDVDSVDKLKGKSIYLIDSINDEKKYGWNSYKYLIGELEFENQLYCLNAGKWYIIDKDFKTIVENDYKNTNIFDVDFNNLESEQTEGKYNLKFFEEHKENYICMDKNNIQYGGGRNKIELCDLLSKNKELVHVKIYNGGSAPLSHLFNQGMNSLELILDDDKFLDLANKKIKEENAEGFEISKEDRRNLTVVFAIASNSDSELPHIPFFSKVSLKYVKKRIGLMGCKVLIKNIKKNNK